MAATSSGTQNESLKRPRADENINNLPPQHTLKSYIYQSCGVANDGDLWPYMAISLSSIGEVRNSISDMHGRWWPDSGDALVIEIHWQGRADKLERSEFKRIGNTKVYMGKQEGAQAILIEV